MASWSVDFVSQTEMEHPVISMASMRQFNMTLINETIAYSIRKSLWRFRQTSVFSAISDIRTHFICKYSKWRVPNIATSVQRHEFVCCYCRIHFNHDMTSRNPSTLLSRMARNSASGQECCQISIRKVIAADKASCEKTRRFFLLVADFCRISGFFRWAEDESWI